MKQRRILSTGFLFLCSLYFYNHMTHTVQPAAAQEVKLFRISDLSGALNLRFQVTDEQETSGDVLARDLNRKFLEGGIRLSTRGSIYHPNLLSFRVDVNLIGHRSKDRYYSDPSVNNALNNTYNIHLSFFKKKKITFDIYTIRNFSNADRIFIGRFFTTYRSTGFKVNSKQKLFPFELDVYNTGMDSESLTYAERYEKTQNIDLRVGLLNKPKTRSMFVLKKKNYSEEVYDLRYRSLEIMATFNHFHGIKDMNTLTSILTFNRLKGDFDLEVLYFRTNAVHYLRPHLHLDGAYTLTVDNSYERSFKKHELEASLNHRLFESLNSYIHLGSRFENSSFQRLTAFRYRVYLNYRKKIPSGKVLLQYSNQDEHSRYSSHDSIIRTSETVDFSLTDTVILSQPGINAASIRLTDPDLSQVYMAGVDYLVETLENVITITRLPGGAIPGGASVLVHFEYMTYPDFRLKSHRYQINFRLNLLKYFHFLYIKRTSNQSTESDYTVPPFESYDKESLGALFTARFLNADYTVERYDSNLSAYTSRNLRLAGHLTPFRPLTLSATMNRNYIKFTTADFFNRYNTYSLETRLQLKSALQINALYRKINYSTPSYSRDRESFLVKVNWAFRKLVVDIFYEHILTGTESYEKGHNFFSVIIRRLF